MNQQPPPYPVGEGNRVKSHRLGTWSRIYLHGMLSLFVLGLVAYLIARLVPLLEFLGSPTIAVTACILALIALPPIVGSILIYAVLPALGKRDGFRGLDAWDDRLLTEVSRAKERARIVVVPWPTKDVRTMGVLTGSIQSGPSGPQLAAVYIPTAPQAKSGYIRVVAMDDLQFTNWTLQQWQLYQLTFGSMHPPSLDASTGELDSPEPKSQPQT